MDQAPDSVTTDDQPPTEVPVAAIVNRLRSSFRAGVGRSLEQRLEALERLEALVVENEEALLDALGRDLGKSPAEGWLTELALVRHSIADLRSRLGHFVRPKRIRVPLAQRPGAASVRREPLGCCLVVAPWNYPVQLLLIPLAGALAAGNTVIAKPSELAPATSALLADLLPRYLDSSRLSVVEGDGATTQELIAAGVDHVFFTGSTETGRAVMIAAAHQLTPVTLELGGKSPAYVDHDADLAVAARRIAFAKFLNAGQVCVAPDYVLAHETIKDDLVVELGRAVRRFFGADPKTSADLGRIVNDRHFTRLVALMDDHGGTVVTGGVPDRSERYFPPTIVVDPRADSALMSGEIFGPILPVIGVADAASAAAAIASRPSPLAIYVFTRRAETMALLQAETQSGAICQNTAAEHFAVAALPFGGVGESGMGAYHGAASLETFTHPRATLRRGTVPETTLAYPPSSAWKRAILRRALHA